MKSRALMVIGVAAALVAALGCRRQPALPDEQYREAVVSFYTGLAALETSQEVLARQKFERVTAIAPDEPAPWANLGLLLLRQQELEAAAERLTKAAELAPENPDIQRLLGLTESRRGNLPEAVKYWKRALALRADDVKAAFALTQDLERQGTREAVQESQQTLERLAQRTGNVVARVEFVRVAAKRGDAPSVQRGLAALAAAANTWPPDVQERFRGVQQQAAADPAATGRSIAFLKNVLMRLPEYRRWLAVLSTPREEVGEPIERFVVLANPPSQPAAPDTALRFAPAARAELGTATWVGVIWPSHDGGPRLASFDGATLSVAGKLVWRSAGATKAGPPSRPRRTSVLAADLNYDYRTDIVMATAAGLTMLRQQPDGTFVDATATMKLPAAILSADAAGLWAADIDTDGDLDVVVASVDGPVRVLRNNGDGTFTVQESFAPAARVRDFAWADLDGDGVPDAALLDASGTVRVLINARGGSFRERPIPSSFPKAVALAAAEVTGDAIVDVVALTASGALVAVAQPADTSMWTTHEIANVGGAAAGDAGTIVLLAADLDNNAATDFVIASRGASQVILRAAPSAAPARVSVQMEARATADLDADGRLELVGVLPDGRGAVAKGTGQKSYGWQVLRPHAATVTGDQRINSFGIGGEVEVRTGLHAQRQIITTPAVHVGLGEARTSEVVRIIWPNGTLQSEFNLAANAAVPASQRLKGSCPWLFAWNGREMAFVTDVLWRSPLGLRINAQETANISMTEDWVRVRGDQLRARDGSYDLRITAELWESHFFDLASLLVVDHPEGTEVFVDERFAVRAPQTAVTVTGPVQAMSAVRDDRGADVADLVRAQDDRHPDFAGRGSYQGVTRDHYIEMELPEGAPRTGPLWLVAQGWVHPTDSSINVALGQGSAPRPRGVSLLAEDRGRFRVVKDLGFPAGKDKTIVADLTGVFRSAGARRLRLSTNMEIFWDRLGWAVGRPDVRIAPERLLPAAAELRYRGYSRTVQSAPSSPERPQYILEGTTPRWRDLEGYHTRFGDVRELLLAVDDRYVIMNAGDELGLSFLEPRPPMPGMVRDFVMITDGWEKDGDFNTSFSRTVLPLPTHRTGRYGTPPGRLEDDPVYRQHPADFEHYHTRYVTPDGVRDALRRRDDTGR